MAELSNALSIPRALTLFVLKDDIRENRSLVGVQNGSNTVFTLPGGDRAIDSPPGIQVKFYRNGVRQCPGVGNDYTVSESGGPGTGFDTITMVDPPLAGEVLLADYVLV